MAKKDDEKEEAEELVTDMDKVKKAIQTCLDFEKEKGIRLIYPKGRKAFSIMYQREEPKRKIEAIIDGKVNQQLEPLNKKIDLLLQLLNDQKKTDIDEMKKKIDDLE